VDVAGEELAVGGQGESSVWSGAWQGGADDGRKLADLAGEDGVPDADLAGCVVEAGLSGEDGEGVGAAVDAVPDAARARLES
jgi:hypothetical protein